MSTPNPNDFDARLADILSEDDAAYVEAMLDKPGFYKEAFDSLSGPGRGMFILSWIGTCVFVAGLLYCLWQLFQAQTLRMQIIYGVFAVMFNSAQIALKLWFNMRLNRQALMREIKRLQLGLARQAGS